jgi:hypothetical protein
VEKLCNGEGHNLFCSLNIIIVITLRMRGVRYVAHMEEMRSSYKILLGKTKGKTYPGLDGMTNPLLCSCEY